MTLITPRPSIQDLRELDPAQVDLVGGKAASLAALTRIDGVEVPDGFCVTTEAMRQVLAADPSLRAQLDRLALPGPERGDQLAAESAALRQQLTRAPLPAELERAIRDRLRGHPETQAWAVRSSATAEDSPGASFAGQHDTALDVRGPDAILDQIRRCWASLYSERAVAYRAQQGMDPRRVHMAVVVQRLIHPRAAGVLFTADPLNGNRRVSVIEAVPGLGEALVSGRLEPDRYRVREGRIVERHAAARPGPPPLSDEQVVALERLGRHIEARLGRPQDIEWCLDEAGLYVVQSRPITTLYPVPDAGAPGLRVFISVGHQQMMTDPLRPLGLSLFQAVAGRPMFAAGGRLFVDPTAQLAQPAVRAAMMAGFGRVDPLIRSALQAVLDRGEIPEVPSPSSAPPLGIWAPPKVEAEGDEAAVIAQLIALSQSSLETLQREIEGRSGLDLIDHILADLPRLTQLLADPRSMASILAGMNSAAWLNDNLLAWLGEKNAADALSQSVENNITSEMGLALMDVADAIRPHPEVVAYLQRATDEGLLDGLLALRGGREVHAALSAWLERYGMRCAGEIDVTRPRWAEAPTTLVPLLLSNLRSFEPGAGGRRFEQGRAHAARREREILERLRELPEGEEKAGQVQRVIRRLRSTIGFREHPKYIIVRRFFVYKQALLAEADRLVLDGVIRRRDDLWYLSLPELRELMVSRRLDTALVDARREEHERFARLSPPRVITSEGEIVRAEYSRDDLPSGALIGLAVSAGVVEGRARVLRDMAEAVLEEGDILVTTFTDPSWTPAFVVIKGLVTEVGGLTTHGAVIAREYGLPAVIGVIDATRRIRDGQRIRVHGTEGYVEILG